MISAYVVPHPPAAVEEVGYKDLEGMRATLNAYKEVSKRIKSDAPQTIVIISPHAPMYADGFYIADGDSYTGDLSQFGAPSASLAIECDTELRREICSLCEIEKVPYGLGSKDSESMDHGSMVPLLFFAKEYSHFKIVRVSPTYLESGMLLKMGKIIERAAAHVGRNIAIIASADLSHRLKEDGPYGFVEEGPIFDKKITDAMKAFDVYGICKLMDDHDFLDRAGQCGTPSITMMAGAIKDYKVSPDFLSYEAPFGVGYAVCAYKCEDQSLRLARKVLETYIRNGKRIKSYEEAFEGETGPEYMINERAGVFVCIKKHGELRGCIGTFLPTTECIANEICRLAIDSGVNDPRFEKVTEDELELLEYTVDILSEPETAEIKNLDVKRYGVIVTNGFRRGLLLPDLEGVDTVEYQLAIALQKAGISPEEGFIIERFTVERH